MAHKIDESKPKYLSQTRFMSGRRIIKTSVTEITDENVVDVLRKALATHELNRSEIDYLWKYYRGDQPIRNRVKGVRPEICNKITENRANEIVSFKVGYLCGEPIQYVSRNGGEEIVKQINTLNEYMFAEDKAAQDQELVEWQMICGTAFRLVLPDEPGEEDEAPFELYTLDPREARAKDSENVFKRAEKKMLKLVLRICRDLGGLTLKLSDIDMKFTRRNYEAIQSKSQVLISMLQEPKIHPQLAFQHSGMFSDAESAYTMSMKYYEEQQEKAAELDKKTAPDDSGDDDNDPDNNDI